MPRWSNGVQLRVPEVGEIGVGYVVAVATKLVIRNNSA